jgi:hypothetical protein
MATNYLFYSLQCQHSRQLLAKLKGSPVCQGINFVNIDDPRVNIPAFVQVVPTLYIATMKKVLSDQELIGWINNMVGGGGRPPMGSSLAPQPGSGSAAQGGFVSMGSITGDDSISPFLASEMVGGSSAAAYSFIDDSLNDKMGHNFGFLDDRTNTGIAGITRSDGAPSGGANTGGASSGGRRGGSQLDKQYEAMMQARNADVPRPMSQMRM